MLWVHGFCFTLSNTRAFASVPLWRKSSFKNANWEPTLFHQKATCESVRSKTKPATSIFCWYGPCVWNLCRYELRNTCQQHACIYRCSAHRFLFSIDAKLILPTLKGIKYRNQTQPKVNTCIKLRQKHVPKLNQHRFNHLYRRLKQSKTSILPVFQ